MEPDPDAALSKVPQVTLAFWVIKILATTLGETGGDWVSMTLDLGYALATAIFLGLVAVAVAAQVSARRFHPALYWAVIVATTTAGTTLADFADRSLGIGYAGGAAILFVLVLASLAAWRLSTGAVRVDAIRSRRDEMFYWATILVSQTLGTALGDWVADSGPGYEGGALIFGAALALVAAAYAVTRLPRAWLFWSAFILTRPLGATIGDLLDKPVADGGMALSRLGASAILVAAMVLLVLLTPQRAGGHPGDGALRA